jgi:hypothetical protein
LSLSDRLRAYLGPRLTPAQKRALNRLRAFGHAGDLARLATVFGSDKEGTHHYTEHYDRHFRHLRHSRINILEIGIGGYDDPDVGGGSLRMWKAYFPRAHVFGIDIYDKSPHDERRIKTFQGSQVDEAFLRRVASEMGTIDIVIDDGSHINGHVIETFRILFPLLSDTGIYAVEDLLTSYWEEEGWGGSSDLSASHTSMNMFKGLADGLNHAEYRVAGYEPTYTDRHVAGVHFYRNLVFVSKGTNDMGRTVPWAGDPP